MGKIYIAKKNLFPLFLRLQSYNILKYCTIPKIRVLLEYLKIRNFPKTMELKI